MIQPTIYIIDGIDRLGKDTLIKKIINEQGHFEVIHKTKPIGLKFYEYDLETYQRASFLNMFYLIQNRDRNSAIIFNRGHLGECVYAPLYRKYDGNYVFCLEESVLEDQLKNHYDIRLILLTTSDFNILHDDGRSFDFNAKEKEQEMFISAFIKSSMPNKVIIDVCDGSGDYKSPEDILTEAIS